MVPQRMCLECIARLLGIQIFKDFQLMVRVDCWEQHYVYTISSSLVTLEREVFANVKAFQANFSTC